MKCCTKPHAASFSLLKIYLQNSFREKKNSCTTCRTSKHGAVVVFCENGTDNSQRTAHKVSIIINIKEAIAAIQGKHLSCKKEQSNPM